MSLLSEILLVIGGIVALVTAGWVWGRRSVDDSLKALENRAKNAETQRDLERVRRTRSEQLRNVDANELVRRVADTGSTDDPKPKTGG